MLVGINFAAIVFASSIVRTALAPPAPAVSDERSDVAALTSPTEVTHVTSEAIQAHPLFTHTRSPHTPETTAPTTAPPPTPPRLVGIVTNAAKRAQALLESASGERRQLLNAGEQFDDWTVVRINRDTITLMPHTGEKSPDEKSSVLLHLRAQSTLLAPTND